MEKCQHEVLEYLAMFGDATCEEIAYFYEGEGKQHIYTSAIQYLAKSGEIRYTGESRKTTNAAWALVFKINTIEDEGEEVDFKSNIHNSKIMRITYEQAIYIRDHLWNKANRDVSAKAAHVRSLVDIMKQGKFFPNSTLQFSKEGILMEGHHRITAQVAAKTDQTYNVQIGCDMEWITGVDVGKRRNAADTTQMHYRLRGRDVNKREAAIIAQLAQHFIGNPDSKEAIRVTGIGAQNHEIETWVQKNEDFLAGYIGMIDELKNTVIDLAEALEGPLKRTVLCVTAEMFRKDKDFTKRYIKAVFGRYSDGVFAGNTPVAVKAIYKDLVKDYGDKKLNRTPAETGSFSVLANGYNLLKEAETNPTKAKRNCELKANSVLLLRKEVGDVLGYVSARPQ